ncbi:MAG: MFS transporter [Thermoanaerobaculia bacterium]|nr:MFS transporter [Thermoanaerobaculia bacterium]
MSQSDRLFTRPFVMLLLAQSVFGLGFSTFLILPTYLATALRASAWEIGLVTSVFGVASMVFMPLAGDWADRSHRLRWAVAGAVISSAAALGFVWVTEVGPLAYALRTLHGIGNAFEFVAAGALVTDLVPARKLGQGFGMFGVTMLSTNAIAPALAESVAARWGWSPVFAAAAAAQLGALVFLTRVVEPERHWTREGSAGLWGVVTSRRSLWLVAVVSLMGGAFAALFTFVQPYALELGTARISSFFVGYTVTAVGVRVFIGGLADRLGRARVSLATMALYAVPMALSAHLRLDWLPWIGALFGVAHGLLYPSLNAFVVEPVKADERAKVFALFMASFNAGWALGSIALGWVAERFGYPAVFWAATAGVACAWLLFASAEEVRRELRPAA